MRSLFEKTNVRRVLQKIKLVIHKHMKRLEPEKQVGKPFYRGIMVYSKACNYTRYEETRSGTTELRAAKMA